MNLSTLGDLELVNYLSKHNTDPIINRLVKIIQGDEGAYAGLIEAGMDQSSWTFSHNYDYYLPGEYIEFLKNELDHLESELDLAKDELEQMTDERDSLKARSIMDLISEMKNVRDSAVRAMNDANRKAALVQEKNDELEEKINVWTVMEQQ